MKLLFHTRVHIQSDPLGALHIMVAINQSRISVWIVAHLFVCFYLFLKYPSSVIFVQCSEAKTVIDDSDQSNKILEYIQYANQSRSSKEVDSFISIPKSLTNIQLGAIFPLTDSTSFRSNVFGVQRLEAFRYLIDLINSGEYGNNDPKITLSWRLVDSQLIPAYAIPAALGFIADGNTTMIIGPNDSQETAAVSEIVSSEGIGVVSYSSSANLGSIIDFSNVLRTVPSDDNTNRVLLELMRAFNWGLIAAVFTDDIYGNTGRSFFSRAHEEGLINLTCTAIFPVATSTSTVLEKKTVLTDMALCLTNSSANVVLIYSSITSASIILSVLTSYTANSRLTYIASAWITFVNDPKTYSNGLFDLSQLKGTVSVIPSVGDTSKFQSYYYSLDPANNNYTFFVSFWEDQFKCKYNPSDTNIPLCPNNISLRTLPISCRCTGNENLTSTQIDLKIGYTWDAVLGAWYSIRSIFRNCSSIVPRPDYPSNVVTNPKINATISERIQKICNSPNMSGMDIITVMRRSSYLGSTGLVEFEGINRANPSFDIVQVDANGLITNIGFYRNGKLYYNESLLQFKTSSIPKSYIVPDDFTFSTTQGAILGSVAILLIIVTFGCTLIILININAPPIKRSSPLFLLLICIGITFLLVGVIVSLIPPNTGAVCFFQTFFSLLGFGLVFGSLMAKTYRIYRIFKVIRLRKKPYSNKELCVFVFIVTLVEMIGLAIWLILSGWPKPRIIYESLGSEQYYAYIQCIDPAGNVIIIILLAYNVVLILTNATLAILTRHVRSEYNESRDIGLTIAGCSIVLIVSLALIVSLDNIKSHAYYGSEIYVVAFILVAFICILFLILPIFRRLQKYRKLTLILANPSRSRNASNISYRRDAATSISYSTYDSQDIQHYSIPISFSEHEYPHQLSLSDNTLHPRDNVKL